MIWWIAIVYLLGFFATFCYASYSLEEEEQTVFGVSLFWPLSISVGVVFTCLGMLYEFFHYRQWKLWKWYRKWKKLDTLL